jgi:hypothetical protein
MSPGLKGRERFSGQMGLRKRLGLRVPQPFTISIVGAGQRQSELKTDQEINRYPASYDKGDDPVSDLKLAIRYEPLELGLLKAAFKVMGPEPLEEWVRQEPSGQFARRAWFLYEWLFDTRLNLQDARMGKIVQVLNPDLQIIKIVGEISARHRVRNNLPGTPALCPMVRVTKSLRAFAALDLADQAQKLVNNADPVLLLRAVDYIYHKETKSSFALEREDVQGSRVERFVAALRHSGTVDWSLEASQTELCNLIVGDPRYAVDGWRTEQNYIGEAQISGVDKVHFIPPKPDDVRSLMIGLATSLRSEESDHDFNEDMRKILDEFPLNSMDDSGDDYEIAHDQNPNVPSHIESEILPFSAPIAAAMLSFAFVFIHPFMDGNGRLHRFMIHHLLKRFHFAPAQMIFPVSAVMLRDRRGYDAALERFSKAIIPCIDWHWRDDGQGGSEVVVENDTADLYRYFDATPQVEYLFHCIREAIEVDLRQELAYLAQFDRGLRALNEVSAMPDRKAQLFVNLIISNGSVSADKRQRLYPELTDTEVERFTQIIRDAIDSSPPLPTTDTRP